MGELTSRDIEYVHGGSRMLGHLCAPTGVQGLPGIVLIHDAFGLNDDTIQAAERYAALGFAVFAADVWGDRTTVTAESQIGPLIGGMVSDHARWMGRIDAAHLTLAAQPEVDAATIISAGYCFGASSALEYLRTGGNTRGVISIHAGLDLLRPGWNAATTPAHVLVCTGADDPMATAEMRSALQQALSEAEIDWELDLYSDTKHAYTNPKSDFSPMPDAVAYNPQSAARSWASTTRFLGELFPGARPAAS